MKNKVRRPPARGAAAKVAELEGKLEAQTDMIEESAQMELEPGAARSVVVVVVVVVGGSQRSTSTTQIVVPDTISRQRSVNPYDDYYREI